MDMESDVLPYLGATVAETNLLGTGISLSLSGLISERQQGVKARFNDPTFLGSAFSLGLAGFFYNGREFFGYEGVFSVSSTRRSLNRKYCEQPPIPNRGFGANWFS